MSAFTNLLARIIDMNDKKILIVNDTSASISNGEVWPVKKVPSVCMYNSADGPLRRGFMEPSRNAPCPCGSGKKYKHCHLDKMTENMRAAVIKASKKNQEVKP